MNRYEQGPELSLQPRQPVKPPERLSMGRASKELLPEERARIFEEVKAQEKESRARLAEMKQQLENLRESLSLTDTNWEGSHRVFEELTELRTSEANSIAGRVKGALGKLGLRFESDRQAEQKVGSAASVVTGLEEQQEILRGEAENLDQLVQNDTTLGEIKEKLWDHFQRAEQAAYEVYERQQRTVEQSMIRNEAFVLHTLTTHPELRHNENSPVAKAATMEDDIDIALSLEPSLSTSSVRQGREKNLFQEKFGNVGLIVGGGDIKSVNESDEGTRTAGIKNRGYDRSTLERIDEVVGSDFAGYNEVVVDNPKIFGLFKSVKSLEDGTLTVNDSDTVHAFEGHINLAREKGLPQFVLTPDRRIYEYISVNEAGRITVGKEITPEDVANGNAGLSAQDRIKVGTEVVSRYLFKDVESQKEAKRILAELKGEEPEPELTREEYMAQLKTHPDEAVSRLYNYPKELLSDKAFMLEAAKIDPEHVYGVVCQTGMVDLAKDTDFIKQIYEMIPPDAKNTRLLARVPRDIIDKDLALLAIERNDDISGVLSEELFNDPDIKGRLIQQLADNFEIRPFEREDIAYSPPYASYEDAEGNLVKYPITQDQDFMAKIQQKYAGIYKIEPYHMGHLLITKLQ